MADDNAPSEHQWTRLLAEMQRTNSLLGGIARSVTNGGGGFGGRTFADFQRDQDARAEEADRAWKQQMARADQAMSSARGKINDTVDGMAGKLKLLGEGTDGAANALKSLARGSMLGSLISQLVDYTGSMIDQYRKMSNLGQNFAGGILEMTTTARAEI
jgi:hypothetical protein